MSLPGYIPLDTTTPQSFGTGAADDRSFNKLINVRVPYGNSDANSLGAYATYIQLNGCTPNNANVVQPYSYSTFQQSSIFLATFKVRNISLNEYGSGLDGAIDVVITGGTSATLTEFDISIDAGTPASTPPVTNTNTSVATFTSLGGALIVAYDITIVENAPEGGGGAICSTVYTITLQTGTTIPSTIKLKSAPGALGKVTGTIYNFGNPVVGSGYSSTVALYNANV